MKDSQLVWFDLRCSGKMVSTFSIEESNLKSVNAQGIIEYIYDHFDEFVCYPSCFTRTHTYALDINNVTFCTPCIYVCDGSRNTHEFIHVSNIRRYL